MYQRSIEEIREKYKDVLENEAVYAISHWVDRCPCGAEDDGGKQEPFDVDKYLERARINAEGFPEAVEKALEGISTK
tara:strand:+ start:34 stop:264 length:231 start_codon:yes stop_codon:yes gene_type:complete